MEILAFCVGLVFAAVFLPISIILAVSVRRMILDGSRIKDLAKRYILITGCDSGFGLLLAKQLDSVGCCVIATCLTAEGKEKLQSTLSARAHVLSLDVTKMESIQAAEKCVQQFLPTPESLWGIVNNAGILIHTGAFDFDTLENMKRISDVNLWGTVAITKMFLPYLKKSKGRIVNVGSMSGRISAPSLCSYSISKSGVAAFNDCIRLELSLFGISVHLLEPGGFRTALNAKGRICSEVEAFWKNAPDDIKVDYKNDWYKDIWYAQLGENYSENLHLVTNCMEHALFSTNPKKRYFPGNDSGMFLWWVALLPAEITDIMYHWLCFKRNPLQISSQ